MEILISLVIGIISVELYVWLDPLSKWLIRWAAEKLPAGRDAEFQAQWEADLASLPNSVFKLYFVLRDCVLPIAEIQQTMFREELAEIADGVDEIVTRQSRVDRVLKDSTALLARSELTGSNLISTLDRALERLQRFGSGHDSPSAIDRCIALKPDLACKFSDYHELLKGNHSLLLEATGAVKVVFEEVARAQLNIRNRVLDPRPIDDADGELLDALISATERVCVVVDGLTDALARCRGVPPELLPATKETCEAFKAAIRFVKHCSGGHA